MSANLPPSELKKIPVPKHADWCAMAASRDYKHIYAGACDNGRIFASHDGGESWIATNSMKSKVWTQIATDESGQRVVATCSSPFGTCQVYLSTDYGYEWNPISGLPSASFEGVSMDKTGQYISVTRSYGIGIDYSHDYGQTWNFSIPVFQHFPYPNTKFTPTPRYAMNKIYMSSNGQHQVVLTDATGILLSHDYGQTWNVTEQVTNHWLKSLSMDESGQYQLLSVSRSGIWYSQDYGNHWEIYSNSPIGTWRDIICVLPSCQIVYAANWKKLSESDDLQGELVDAAVYKSTNYGKTWKRTSTPHGEGWTSLVVDSTGKKVTVGLSHTSFIQSMDGGQSWSVPYGSEDHSIRDFLKGIVIGCIIVIPILICLEIRRRMKQQNVLILRLQQQQQQQAPVHATVELAPMHIGTIDIESSSVSVVPAFVLDPIKNHSSTANRVCSVGNCHDDVAEKEQLLSSPSSS